MGCGEKQTGRMEVSFPELRKIREGNGSFGQGRPKFPFGPVKSESSVNQAVRWGSWGTGRGAGGHGSLELR